MNTSDTNFEPLPARAGSSAIVVCGHDRVSPAMMMAIHAAAAGLGEVIVLPPHIQPKQPQDFEILKAALNHPPLLWHPPLKQTKRERTHPNEPFYCKLNRRRKW